MEDDKETVAEALFNGEREAKIKAALCISTLTPLQRNKLVDMGVVEPLIFMLQSRDHESMETALFALLSLSIRSLRSKVKIVELGSLPSLIWILEHKKGLLVELSIVILLSLSSCTAKNSAFLDSGVVPLLIKFLNFVSDDVHFDDMQVKFDSLDILCNLSTNNQAVALMISQGYVFCLLEVKEKMDKRSKLVDKAIGLLDKFVSLSEIGISQIGGVKGGILALVETVEDGSQQSREHAAGVLYLMCKSCREKYRELILREGVMPGLLQLQVDGTLRAIGLARSLLLLLRESSLDYGLRRRQIIKNWVLEHIVNEIESDEKKAEEATVKLVKKMTTLMNFAV